MFLISRLVLSASYKLIIQCHWWISWSWVYECVCFAISPFPFNNGKYGENLINSHSCVWLMLSFIIIKPGFTLLLRAIFMCFVCIYNEQNCTFWYYVGGWKNIQYAKLKMLPLHKTNLPSSGRTNKKQTIVSYEKGTK